MAARLGWPTWIGVVVGDLERARRFWEGVVGQPVTDTGPDYVQWEFGDGRIFELIERSDAPEYDRPRFQVGFAVEDIRTARQELMDLGAHPITEIMDGEVSSWAYFRDPEGNVFEITQRPGLASARPPG
jgi:predicted enzyme related to lactoylglutathione lyase